MSEPTTIDNDAKQRVKEALLAQVRAGLETLAGQAAAERSATRFTDTDQPLPDDLSQADAAGDLATLFEQSQARQQENLRQIESLDFSPADSVAPGALVGFGGSRYVVGVVTDEFECDGATYEGISADSPIYALIAGLRLGDTFEFNGRSDRIDFLA